MKLMVQVEKEKAEMGPVEDAQMQVEEMALKVFNKGDEQYRAGKADLNTSISLYVCMGVCMNAGLCACMCW
jgi:hypothetical protein